MKRRAIALVTLLTVLVGVALAQVRTATLLTSPVDIDRVYAVDMSQAAGSGDRAIQIGELRHSLTDSINLSQATDFADAITTIGTNGTINIDANETLGNSTYTIPRGVTIQPAGGVLTAPDNTAAASFGINIRGPVARSNVEWLNFEDTSDMQASSVINWGNGERINPWWLGLRSTSQSGAWDAAENLAAMEAAYIFAQGSGASANAAGVRVPAGRYRLSGEIDVQAVTTAAIQATTQGDGSITTVLELDDNANSSILDYNDVPNGSIQDMGFDGRVSGPNTLAADTPLLNISAYTFFMKNIEVRNSASDGIHWNSSQHNTVQHVKAASCTGWGGVIKDVWNIQLDGCDFEQNTLGGLRIIPLSDAEGRTRSRIRINTIYLENNTGPGIQIEGMQNVEIQGPIYDNSTSTAVKLTEHTATGTFASYNYVNASNCSNSIVIDDGCHSNVILYNPSNNACHIYDNDGRNEIRPWVGMGATFGLTTDWNTGDYSGTDISDSTRPHDLNFTTGTGHTKANVEGTIVPAPAAMHNGTVAGPTHVQLTTPNDGTGSTGLQITASSNATASTTYYLQVIVSFDNHCTFYLTCEDDNGGASDDSYDWETKSWVAAVENLYLPVSKHPQMIVIPVDIDGETDRDLRFRLGVQNGFQSVARYYYCNITTNPRQGIVYRTGGAEFGRGRTAEYTDAARPAADEVPKGTEIWNTDDNAPNWSDGTNWRDGDGNVTARRLSDWSTAA